MEITETIIDGPMVIMAIEIEIMETIESEITETTEMETMIMVMMVTAMMGNGNDNNGNENWDTEDIGDTEGTGDLETTEYIEDTENTGDVEDTKDTEDITDIVIWTIGGWWSLGGGWSLVKDFCPTWDASHSYYDRSCVVSTIDTAVLSSETSLQDSETIIISKVSPIWLISFHSDRVSSSNPLIEESVLALTPAPVLSNRPLTGLSFLRSSLLLNFLFVPLWLFFLYCLYLQAKRLDERAIITLQNHSFWS